MEKSAQDTMAPSSYPASGAMDNEKASDLARDTDGEIDYSNLPEERRPYARELAAMTPAEYAAFEKKTLWKMDLNIIPWITLLYLISFLDRVNVGAARLVGLMEDLKLTSLMFSNISMIFFISYVVFEVPSNLVLKKFKPSRWIPLTMVLWAIFQTCMGFVKTYEQLLALRFCLGIFEAGLFPGLNLYLTGWYRREEINKRVAVFFAGAVLAGAFGGIFGFALGKMAGVGGLNGWSWIFIIEGLLTFVIGVASYWMVHDWPQEARLLTPLEREFILNRLAKEQGVGDATLTKSIAKQAFLDWKMWAMMLAYIGAGEPLYSLALFSPTVIASLGTFTRPQSLLLSTPPYVLCFFTTIGTAVLSDKYKRRAPFLIFWGSVCAIGYILLLAIPLSSPGARYFAVFVAAAGAGPMIATTISWTANTWTPNHYKKAIAMGMVFSAGNAGGIVSSQAYRDNNAPRYVPGHATAVAFALCNVFASALMWYKFDKENKRRDALYGKPPGPGEVVDTHSDEYLDRHGLRGMTGHEIAELADHHPAFRYVL